MFCGTSSLRCADDDPLTEPPPPPRTVTTKGSKRKHGENPYSSRGLDKFSSVLTELEERKKKIMARAATAGGAAAVRFTYSDSRHWIPVIIRVRDRRSKEEDPENHKKLPEAAGQKPAAVQVPKRPEWSKVKKVSGEEWWRRRASNYTVMAAAVVVVNLVIFGRVFAIFCTSAWWYLVPVLMGEEGGRRRGGRGRIGWRMKKEE